MSLDALTATPPEPIEKIGAGGLKSKEFAATVQPLIFNEPLVPLDAKTAFTKLWSMRQLPNAIDDP